MGSEIIYLSLHCHRQNDSYIKMDSNKSHFNVSVGSNGQSHKTVSTDHKLFEEKGEPKRYRTEVLPLTSLIRKTKSCSILSTSPAVVHSFLAILHHSVLLNGVNGEQTESILWV